MTIFYNFKNICRICYSSHGDSASADKCFAGHGLDEIGEFLHFRICPCLQKVECYFHTGGRGNPEGWRMYWYREAMLCELIAKQSIISIREACFRYINAAARH